MGEEAVTEEIEVKPCSTTRAGGGNLLVSIPDGSLSAYLRITVGAVGRENMTEYVNVGEFIKYDAGRYGQFEVRFLSLDPDANKATFLVTRLR